MPQGDIQNMKPHINSTNVYLVSLIHKLRPSNSCLLPNTQSDNSFSINNISNPTTEKLMLANRQLTKKIKANKCNH